MSDYGAGFEKGERDSFTDRSKGQLRPVPSVDAVDGDYVRGYWDGYRPRDVEWASRPTRVTTRYPWAHA